METVYEKVCPACGRSALLAAKFCSGCGHEYRTVFHDDDSQPAAATAAAESGRDSAWIPYVLAIAPVVFVVFLLFATRTAQPVTVSSAAPSSYGTVASTPSSVLPQYGMSMADVQQQLGQPANVARSSVAGDNAQDWYYPWPDGRKLGVHFNSNGVVASYNFFQ
jgi:hypothetical protein